MKTYTYTLLLFWSNIIIAQNKGFTPTNTNTTERRFALVIGNKDYTSIGTLKNPINDAMDVSKAFQQLGFEVTTITNADYKKMLNGFNVFTKKLQKNDVVVFYYSGHGISYDGKNFLIPTDASITCLEEVEENALTLGRLMTSVEAKNVKNCFVFLDACRNLPNLKQCDASTRDLAIAKGLVRPTNNPSGSMTVYATREGDTADDNSTDRNGLFTSEFLKHINIPNLGLRQILDRTKKGVETRSNKRQIPVRYDELSDDFVFIKNSKGEIKNSQIEESQGGEEASKNSSNIEEMLKFASDYSEIASQEYNFKLSKFWLEKAIEVGSKDAILKLGQLYYKDNGTFQNDFSAIYWFEKAAENDNPIPMIELAFMYQHNLNVKDLNKAKFWFEKAANIKSSSAMFWLGCLYLEEKAPFKENQKAINWLEESAKLNEITAINYLGDLYYEGRIEKQNFSKAKFWYKKSCELKDEIGCENLAKIPTKL